MHFDFLNIWLQLSGDVFRLKQWFGKVDLVVRKPAEASYFLMVMGFCWNCNDHATVFEVLLNTTQNISKPDKKENLNLSYYLISKKEKHIK